MEKKNCNILAIGAHPDDVEMGCGGALMKHLALGDNVYVLIITHGEKGYHVPGEEECFNSLEKIGIKKENVFFGDFPDGFVIANQELVDFIERKIHELNIERVYTHYPEDRHQDHRNLSLATSSAARKISTLLLFQGPSTAVNFEPHYFINISDEILNTKLRALRCYESQVKKKVVDLELMKSLAIINGRRINAEYAEAFALNHMNMGGDNV